MRAKDLTPEEDPTSLKRLSSSQQHRRSPISGQLSARANEIPWIWDQGQLMEKAGLLVSKSLTLSSAHV